MGGAGVAAVALGSVFGALTFSAVGAQKADCGAGPSCANPSKADSDHSASATDSTVATIAFIAGGALLAGGAALFFTAPSASSAAPEPTGLRVVPSLGPTGAGAMLRATF